MKKILCAVLLFLILGVIAVSADESELFVKSMPITKIYIHRLGFRVVYLKTDLTQGEFYVPMEWFDQAGGKGILVKGTDPAYPFFSIFWRNGEFDSIKLYTKSNLSHDTWGDLPYSPDLAERFNVDTLELDF